MKLTELSGMLHGRVVADLEAVSDHLELRFNDGSFLVIRQTAKGVSLVLHQGAGSSTDGANRPTRRQREYLDFIRQYMARHGFSPAESDIQNHFMVSAPSAHQMVETLERRGFIIRDRDFLGNVVPRSIRVAIA